MSLASVQHILLRSCFSITGSLPEPQVANSSTQREHDRLAGNSDLHLSLNR